MTADQGGSRSDRGIGGANKHRLRFFGKRNPGLRLHLHCRYHAACTWQQACFAIFGNFEDLGIQNSEIFNATWRGSWEGLNVSSVFCAVLAEEVIRRFRPPITGCSIAEFLRLSSSCRKIRSKTALGDSRSDNLIPNSLLCTVEGELGVASFLVIIFSRVYFQTLVAVHPCPFVPQVPLLTAEGRIGGLPQLSSRLVTPPILPSSFPNPARVSAFVSAIMAPQLDAA
jgi:hypothetical protein